MEIYNLSKEIVGSLDLNEKIFNLTDIRTDIIKMVIDWQLARKRTGCHKIKTVAEVSGTGKKPFKQKGTGRARQGTLRAVQMRGGGHVHGPLVRSHAMDLPKKVRKLGLCHSLSAKNITNNLFLINNLEFEQIKTKSAKTVLTLFGEGSFCIIADYTKYKNFLLSVRNIFNVKILPQNFVNVYDIMKHDYLILTVEAVEELQKRLG